MKGRILDQTYCLRKLRNMETTDRKGRTGIPAEKCGIKTWGMIDFLAGLGFNFKFI